MKCRSVFIFLLAIVGYSRAQQNLLVNAEWKFIRYTNNEASTSFNLTSYDFSLRFDSNKVYMKICNQLSARYTFNANQINVKSLFGTKSSCEDKISNTEYAVVDNFNSLTYIFKADTLILSNEKTKHNFFYIKKK